MLIPTSGLLSNSTVGTKHLITEEIHYTLTNLINIFQCLHAYSGEPVIRMSKMLVV